MDLGLPPIFSLHLYENPESLYNVKLNARSEGAKYETNESCLLNTPFYFGLLSEKESMFIVLHSIRREGHTEGALHMLTS